MSLPAQDAFGLTHPSRPTRRPSLSLTSMRSSLSSKRSPSPASRLTKRPARTSRPPSSSSNGFAPPSPTSNGHITSGTETDTNGRANGHARKGSKHKRKLSKALANGKEKVEEKIDWEIPRKVFHSSIGFLTAGLYLSHTPPRFIILSLLVALAVIVPSDILRFRYLTFARAWEACVGSLMRESEKDKVNGTIWYILGVVFVLAFYPLDIAVVSILILSWADTAASTVGRAWGRHTPPLPAKLPILGLSFASRKSTAGFLAAVITGTGIVMGFWGYMAPYGISNVGLERMQDLAWTWIGVGPSFTGGHGLLDFASFFGNQAVAHVEAVNAVVATNTAALDAVLGSAKAAVGFQPVPTGGWIGLTAVGLTAGLVTGVAEALDLGSLDDNLTLPIISGGCIWAAFKVLSWISS